MDYDPILDSNREGYEQLVDARDYDRGPLIIIRPGECFCGCHERPTRKRRFKPGHDTRFRAILRRAHDAGVPVTVGNEKHRAEWWVVWLQRKESEAVRRRDDRRAAAVEGWLDGRTPEDAVVEEMDTDPNFGVREAKSKLAEVERLATRDQRRFDLDAKRPSPG